MNIKLLTVGKTDNKQENRAQKSGRKENEKVKSRRTALILLLQSLVITLLLYQNSPEFNSIF